MTLEALERHLGYRFSSGKLLQQALTHRSHGADHNERLEFVGDSILNCVIASHLFFHFPTLREGELSRLRASLVREATLAEMAAELDLGRLIKLGAGEVKTGGAQRPSILADAMEAILGAVYLDGGFEQAERVITALFSSRLNALDPASTGRDAKTELQEYLQGRRFELPEYVLLATHGEAHTQSFEVECRVPRMKLACRGEGSSRRMAEQASARAALAQLKTL